MGHWEALQGDEGLEVTQVGGAGRAGRGWGGRVFREASAGLRLAKLRRRTPGFRPGVSGQVVVPSLN